MGGHKLWGVLGGSPHRVPPPRRGSAGGGGPVALCSGRAEPPPRPPPAPQAMGQRAGSSESPISSWKTRLKRAFCSGEKWSRQSPTTPAGRRGRGSGAAAAGAGAPLCPPDPHPVPPLTFPHEASLAVVHDLLGDEGVVGHGVVPHGGEAAVLLQGFQRLGAQRAAQEGAEPLRRGAQVLRRRGRSAPGSRRGRGRGRAGAHLVQLLVGDVEDVQELPLAQPALDVVKPGAVVHWGEAGGDGGPQGPIPGSQGDPSPYPCPLGTA